MSNHGSYDDYKWTVWCMWSSNLINGDLLRWRRQRLVPRIPLCRCLAHEGCFDFSARRICRNQTVRTLRRFGKLFTAFLMVCYRLWAFIGPFEFHPLYSWEEYFTCCQVSNQPVNNAKTKVAYTSMIAHLLVIAFSSSTKNFFCFRFKIGGDRDNLSPAFFIILENLWPIHLSSLKLLTTCS